MEQGIFLALTSIVLLASIWATISLILTAYEVFGSRFYSIGFKIRFATSLCILLIGIAGLANVGINVWNEIQTTNAVRQRHETEITNGIQRFDAKMNEQFKDDVSNWKRTE